MVMNELLKIIMGQSNFQLSGWFFLVPNLAMETVKNVYFLFSKVWPEYNKLLTRSGPRSSLCGPRCPWSASVQANISQYGAHVWLVGSLSKPRRRGQRERHQTKDLMSKTIAVHVRYNSSYISFPSSANSNNVKWPSSVSSTERGWRRLIFAISSWNWTSSLHI